MALVTIQRSPSPSNDPESVDGVDGGEESGSSRSPLRQRSLSESYFTVKGAALILPQNDHSSRRTSKKNHGGDMQHHLQAMLHTLRPEDKMKMAVKLENVAASTDHRYLALVSTIGRQDEEESVVLGIDYKDTASIGLVIPILSGTKISLDGDGGFSIKIQDGQHLFKPVSVQVMWSAIQSLEQGIQMADNKMYTSGGLSHTWVSYYNSKIDNTDKDRISQWHMMEGIWVNLNNLVAPNDDEDEEVNKIKKNITLTLYDIMMTVDLDEATCLSLRNAVEEKLNIGLKPYRAFFDKETMRILGQMDRASKITDVVYLGSEWNAANIGELQQLGIGYILNVTREIDNFFQGMFHYKNIRLWDVPESNLLDHWNKTYDFIDRARKNKSKVLIHCKMGISRSASTAMAFLMKDNKWSLDQAFQFVKEKRAIVNPNSGFMEQLKTYEGILSASNQRHTFHSMVQRDPKSRLGSVDREEEDFLEQGAYMGIEPSDLPLCKPKNIPEEDWIAQLPIDNINFPIEKDLETGSRSADSMEESLPDIPSPTPDSSTSKIGSYYFTKISQPVSGEVAGADLPYDSSSEDSEEDEEGLGIPGAAKHTMHTHTSSSVPSNPTFKDDFSWIKPQESDKESSPSSENYEAPVLILASDFNPHILNNNMTSLEIINQKPALDNLQTTTETAIPALDNQQTVLMEMEESTIVVSTAGIKSQSTEIYSKEDIPWSSGTVQKIRDGLVNTTVASTSTVIGSTVVSALDSYNANTNTTKILSDLSTAMDINIEKQTERPTGGLKCSHSCSELLSMDRESESERPSKRQCPLSVYDKEEIEWTEGIVRKTTMQIEERAKPSEAEIKKIEFAKPIQRSASLKEATEIAKAKRAERRKTCSPIVTPSPTTAVVPGSDSQIEIDPRPLVFVDEDKRRSSVPENIHPEILIGGVTLDESTDIGDPDPVTVYRYGSEEVPLKSGIVRKYKQGYETMDTNESDNIANGTSGSSSTSPHIPTLQLASKTTETQCQKVTAEVKDDVQGPHLVPWKKEKYPYNKEEMEYIKDVGSMLSHKQTEQQDVAADTKSAVFNVVRDIENKTKEKVPEKKIVIIDNDSKKSKLYGEKTEKSSESVQLKSSVSEILKPSVLGQDEKPQLKSEISDRSALNLDLKCKTTEESKDLNSSPELVHKISPAAKTTPLDSDQSVVKILKGRFEAKDTSPSLDSKPTTLGVCVAKGEPSPVAPVSADSVTQSNDTMTQSQDIVSQTIDESDEDEHLVPEYVEMRNNLNRVHPSVTQKYRLKSSDIIHRQNLRTKSVSDAPPSQRHSAKIDQLTSDEIRRVRRNQLGSSHPLTRLGASPFYNTM